MVSPVVECERAWWLLITGLSWFSTMALPSGMHSPISSIVDGHVILWLYRITWLFSHLIWFKLFVHRNRFTKQGYLIFAKCLKKCHWSQISYYNTIFFKQIFCRVWQILGTLVSSMLSSRWDHCEKQNSCTTWKCCCFSNVWFILFPFVIHSIAFVLHQYAWLNQHLAHSWPIEVNQF